MAKDTIGLEQLEEILFRETSMIDPDDVPALMETIRKEARS